MNIAIILGVSLYSGNALDDLPACEADAKLVKLIIDLSGKFEDTLLISGELKSANTKKMIAEFVSKHRSEEIDEVFLYFSGHGHYDGSEFYYILSDYEKNRFRQTSLQNSEIDDMLRALNPNNTIKVIDACNSGVGYIKETDNIVEYVKSASGKFNKCYFLFSSHNDQPSYADRDLSDFTRSFCSALARHDSETIRYKDIVDYIADEFSENSRQKPLFAIQADLTEVFMELNDELRQEIARSLSGLAKTGATTVPSVDVSQTRDLVELVKAVAETYKDKEFISEQFVKLKTRRLSWFWYIKTISSLLPLSSFN